MKQTEDPLAKRKQVPFTLAIAAPSSVPQSSPSRRAAEEEEEADPPFRRHIVHRDQSGRHPSATRDDDDTQEEEDDDDDDCVRPPTTRRSTFSPSGPPAAIATAAVAVASVAHRREREELDNNNDDEEEEDDDDDCNRRPSQADSLLSSFHFTATRQGSGSLLSNPLMAPSSAMENHQHQHQQQQQQHSSSSPSHPNEESSSFLDSSQAEPRRVSFVSVNPLSPASSRALSPFPSSSSSHPHRKARRPLGRPTEGGAPSSFLRLPFPVEVLGATRVRTTCRP